VAVAVALVALAEQVGGLLSYDAHAACIGGFLSRHTKTMEVGGWTLLIAAIAFLLYLLFHKDGQQAMTGGTVVSNKIGGVQGAIAARPDDPSKPTTYMDDAGHTWIWSPTGQQWTPTEIAASDAARNLAVI
jgi:hypothetical protein